MIKTRLIVGPLILLCIAGLFFSACEKDVRANPPRLLVVEHTEENLKIFSMESDGSHQTLLAELPRITWYWLSPDGKHLAYLKINGEARDGVFDLDILDTSSGVVIRSVPNVMQSWSEDISWAENVVWSPQGDKLAFLRSPTYGEKPDIYLYELSTDLVEPLVTTEAVERAPSWSPDGEQMVFVSWDGCESDDCLPYELVWDIWLVDQNGNTIPIVTDSDEEIFLSGYLWDASICNLTWSPDEKHIAFENQCGVFIGITYGKEVFVTEVRENSAIEQITHFSENFPNTMFKYSLHWAKGNEALNIGYLRAEIAPDGEYFGGILAYQSGFALTEVFEKTGGMRGDAVRWSPDDAYLAWHTNSSDSTNEMIVPGKSMIGKFDEGQIASLNELSKFLTDSCGAPEFYWSPGSNFVAYIANDAETKCSDEDRDRSVVIISISDREVIYVPDIAENIELIGWIPSQ